MSTHDPAYKQFCVLCIWHPEMVADLLRGYVHEAWVGQIDFATLERVPDSQSKQGREAQNPPLLLGEGSGEGGGDLREREDDIIWRVSWGHRWLYLYLLIEFQSTVDRHMAVRLITYVGLLYQDLRRTGRIGSTDRLPPVLPIVLYIRVDRPPQPRIASPRLHRLGQPHRSAPPPAQREPR
ncbi:MAG TPA: Rpn family recombination-promoting nuclease/putative transposase [Nitrospira sp.]|nr:Rpn family recombination-promoting nuclease/putative transposase [Nitrospira sp.]